VDHRRERFGRPAVDPWSVPRVRCAIDLALTSPTPFAALAALQLGLLDACIFGLHDRVRVGLAPDVPLAPLLSGFLAEVPDNASAVADVDWLVLWHFRANGEVGSLSHLRSLSTELCALADVPPRVAAALAFGARRLGSAALHTAITRIEAVTLALATPACVPERLRVLSSALKHAARSGGGVDSAATQIEPLILRIGWDADARVVVDAVRGPDNHSEPSAAERFAARVAIGAALVTI
jgi:hypothetical protein